jgi:hypothetical protein
MTLLLITWVCNHCDDLESREVVQWERVEATLRSGQAVYYTTPWGTQFAIYPPHGGPWFTFERLGRAKRYLAVLAVAPGWQARKPLHYDYERAIEVFRRDWKGGWALRPPR